VCLAYVFFFIDQGKAISAKLLQTPARDKNPFCFPAVGMPENGDDDALHLREEGRATAMFLERM
jgi:hypothetical protein